MKKLFLTVALVFAFTLPCLADCPDPGQTQGPPCTGGVADFSGDSEAGIAAEATTDQTITVQAVVDDAVRSILLEIIW